MANKVCIIESDKIVDGGSLMKGNTNLIKWNSNLSNLVTSDEMFSGCTSLVSFTGNLNNLETAGFDPFIDRIENYESGETVVTTISTAESGMFYNCKSLNSFDIPLPLLKNGSLMFYGTGLTEFHVDLSKLENGSGMFQNTNLTSFSSNLSSLVKGGNCGYYDEVEYGGIDENGYWHVTSYHQTEKYPSGMFENTKITTWNIDLPNLEYSYRMFADCRNLISFSGNLSSLSGAGHSLDGYDYGYETIDGMFLNCINLNSFSSNISSVNGGDGMFLNCFSLSSIGENTLENLWCGNLMFSGTKISSINFNISSLTHANGMFLTCPFITHCDVPSFYDEEGGGYARASCMFGFNLYQLDELCQHNGIEIYDLPIASEGQCICLDNFNKMPTFSTCMFGVIPDQAYFSDGLTKIHLPLPSGNHDDIYDSMEYDIDIFNPTLHLFCRDINSIINNSGDFYDITYFVHGRHLTTADDVGDNTVEILTALASKCFTPFGYGDLGCVTATPEIIDEFISFGWECVSDEHTIDYSLSQEYPKVINLRIPTQNINGEYYTYITIFHDGSWSN